MQRASAQEPENSEFCLLYIDYKCLLVQLNHVRAVPRGEQLRAGEVAVLPALGQTDRAVLVVCTIHAQVRGQWMQARPSRWLPCVLCTLLRKRVDVTQ